MSHITGIAKFRRSLAQLSAQGGSKSQLWGQLRFLRALSSLVLKNSTDNDHTVFHCLTVLMGKRFEYLLFKFMPVFSCPPVMHCCEEPFFRLLDDLSSQVVACCRPLNSTSKTISYLGGRIPNPSPSLYWASASDPTIPVALCWACSGLSMFLQ